MPTYSLFSGLPDLPVGLDDKDYALVAGLYRAINALAQQVATITGNVQYSATEQSQMSQLQGLTDFRQQRIYAKAIEAIPYGRLVNLTVDGGKLAIRLADATTTAKPAHAACDVVGGIAAGEFGAVLFRTGLAAGVSGSTVGATYYLSTAGLMQLAAPTAPGSLVQIVATGLGNAGAYLNIEPVGVRP